MCFRTTFAREIAPKKTRDASGGRVNVASTSQSDAQGASVIASRVVWIASSVCNKLAMSKRLQAVVHHFSGLMMKAGRKPSS